MKLLLPLSQTLQAIAIGVTSMAVAVWALPFPPPHEPTVNAMVAAYVRDNPEAIIASLNAHMESERLAKQASENDAVFAAGEEILATKNLPVLGNPDGTVTLAYFFDVNCPYCRKMHPVLNDMVEANPDLRIVHREMPILRPSSEHAARMSMIIWNEHPDSYQAWHHAVMTADDALSDDDVYALAASVVGDDAVVRYREMILSGAGIGGVAELAVADNLELADRIGVRGTPFLFMDGQVIRGAVSSERLQEAIDASRTGK